MAIDGQPLDSNISHEQAISILQKARGLVELVVARSAQGNYRIYAGIRLPVTTVGEISLDGSRWSRSIYHDADDAASIEQRGFRRFGP